MLLLRSGFFGFSIKFFFCYLPFALVTSCGGSGNGGDNDDEDPISPVAQFAEQEFQSENIEFETDITTSVIGALRAIDPADPEAGQKAFAIHKVTNNTGVTTDIDYVVDIPKNFAEHVDDMRYKVILNADENLTADQLIADSGVFLSIDELVDMGLAIVIEEDPVIHLLIGGAIAIGSTYIFFERPDLAGLTPRTHPSDIFKMNLEQRKQWSNDQLLGEHCGSVVESASDNNIPSHLLANIILNEVADYGWEDTLQELVYTGENRSHGWIQLQPSRVLGHGLIDIGPRESLRNPEVDIDEDSLIIDIPGEPGDPGGTFRKSENAEIWRRLLKPKSAIEIAAREIDYLLKLLEPGSPAASNPWAASMLIDPAKGIDRNDIYGNLKVLGNPTDPIERQIALDRTLTVLIASAYNGSGAILFEENESAVFTEEEINSGMFNPWEVPGDIDELIPGTENFRYRFRDPRVHGDNGGTFFPRALRESECLNGVFEVSVTINDFVSHTFVPFFKTAGLFTLGAPLPITLTIVGASDDAINPESLSLNFNTSAIPTTGTYNVSGSLAMPVLVYQSPEVQHAAIGEDTDGLNVSIPAVSGSVTLTSYELEVGGRVAGSFSVGIAGARITGRDEEELIETEPVSGSLSGSFDVRVVDEVSP